MLSLRKSLLQFVFSGASMRRWNDKLRPTPLCEVDKQAHKMIVAFLLYQMQCRRLPSEERLALGRAVAEGALFDYLYRLIITDIKPPVFYRIKANPRHYRELTQWVLQALETQVKPLDSGFWDRLVAWHMPEGPLPGLRQLAADILHTAHLYASRWEFEIIRPLNFFDEEMDSIGANFAEQLKAMTRLEGVSDLLAEPGANGLSRMANLCGQLRFQIRWSQTPRVPETSVLGHMFIVASYAYFFSLSLGLTRARALNNFFCGLFHDLPELLTRDIISPVKKSVADLPRLIQDYEGEVLEDKILRPLAATEYQDIVSSLGYYLGLDTGSEFHQTICGPGGQVLRLNSFEETPDDDALNPKDGILVKHCDQLAAFIEAHTSVSNGVSSAHLYEAMARIRSEYRKLDKDPCQINTILADFD